MQIRIDSFVVTVVDPVTRAALAPAQRLENLLEEVELAEQVGLDVFGIGEHHRPEFLDSAPAILLAAAAARTKRIRLASAVAVLSAADPVRVYQEFATIDLLSRGRVDLVVGRGSFGESYPLFGYQFEDYHGLFVEKLDLLLLLRESAKVHWKGRHRAPLTGQGVYPRSFQDPLPVWVGVSGTTSSFARAGRLGLPLMIAIIGGEPYPFRSMVDIYRDAAQVAGHLPEKLPVGVHAVGYVAETDAQAADEFYPGYSRMFSDIGSERGWPPVQRKHYDAQLGPSGALVVGSPETIAAKIKFFDLVLWNELSDIERKLRRREHVQDILSAVIALIWQICLFLIPMQILTRNYASLEVTLPIFLLGSAGLYFVWWRNLPPANEKIADFASRAPVRSPKELQEVEHEAIRIRAD